MMPDTGSWSVKWGQRIGMPSGLLLIIVDPF